ncbi:MAG: PAS domain-containing protein [Pseudomonadota bacterium]
MAGTPHGVATQPSAVDGVPRIAAWRTLDDYPLFVASSLDIDLVLGADQRQSHPADRGDRADLAGWLLLRALDQRAALSASVAQSREQLVEAQRLGKIGHFVVDSVRGCVTYSDECFPMMGYTPTAEVSTERGLAVIHPDDLERYLAIRDGAGGELEARVLRADGTSAGRICGCDRAPTTPATASASSASSRDISARKLAEEAVRQKDLQIRAIMDNAPVAIFLKDRGGRYRTVNQQVADMIGIPMGEIIGRTDAELGPAIGALSRATDAEVLEHGKITRIERPAREPRPGHEYVEILKFPIFGEDGSIVGLSGFTFNVTERRRIEEQLRQAAKMEAVGRLAGGVAHDFNNMIGAISGFSSFLLEDLEPTTPQHHFAERIAQVCQHAKHLVQQILTFARAGEVDKRDDRSARGDRRRDAAPPGGTAGINEPDRECRLGPAAGVDQRRPGRSGAAQPMRQRQRRARRPAGRGLGAVGAGGRGTSRSSWIYRWSRPAGRGPARAAAGWMVSGFYCAIRVTDNRLRHGSGRRSTVCSSRSTAPRGRAVGPGSGWP